MKVNISFDDILQIETSKRNTNLIADFIYQKPELFEELYRIFKRNEEPVSRRAAWVIDTVSEKHPELIAPFINDIVEMLPAFRHDALKRHSMRILTRSPLPSGNHLGELIKISFDWLASTKEAIAVKVYSMELLCRVSMIEPDIRKELADTIEWRIGEESAGFQNRGKKVLRNLYQEIARSENTF